MVASHTSGELALISEVVQQLLVANSSPNTILHISIVSSARSRAVTLPTIGLSEYLKPL